MAMQQHASRPYPMGPGAPRFGGPAPTSASHPQLTKLRLLACGSMLLGPLTGIPGLVLAVLALRLSTHIRAQVELVGGHEEDLRQVRGWRIVAGFGVACGIVGTISVLLGLLLPAAGPAAR